MWSCHGERFIKRVFGCGVVCVRDFVVEFFVVFVVEKRVVIQESVVVGRVLRCWDPSSLKPSTAVVLSSCGIARWHAGAYALLGPGPQA